VDVGIETTFKEGNEKERGVACHCLSNQLPIDTIVVHVNPTYCRLKEVSFKKTFFAKYEKN
jgi:hypothetical protein